MVIIHFKLCNYHVIKIFIHSFKKGLLSLLKKFKSTSNPELRILLLGLDNVSFGLFVCFTYIG